MSSRDTDVAVVGAGPYGLSLAAHLAGLGVEHRAFGAPVATWRGMPPGMRLKSDGFASSLSAPGDGWRLRDWSAREGVDYHDTDAPVALETFNAYALDFQRRFVPRLESQDVADVAPAPGGWRLRLADGETFTARRVALAVGITHYALTPSLFAGLPPERVSHSSAHHDFERFRGLDVAIVGGGSSAVDMAIGLGGVGARARVIVRGQGVNFTSPGQGGRRSAWARLRHPQSGLGPGLRSWLACEAPDLFRLLPAAARLEIVRRHLGPLSNGRERARFEASAEVLPGRRVTAVSGAGDGRVRLDLSGAPGDRLDVDHVICATGYRADVSRLAFLDAGTRAGLRTVGGAPVLSADFESSAPGLHFVGLSAAATFGPLMRFMFGADFAARRLSRRLAR